MEEKKFSCKETLIYGWDHGKKISGQTVLENPVYILFFAEPKQLFAGEIHFVRSLRHLQNSMLLRDPSACAEKMEEARKKFTAPLPEKIEEQPQCLTGDAARFFHAVVMKKDKMEEEYANLQKKYAALDQRFEHYKKQVGNNDAAAFFKKMLLGPDKEQ